MGLIDGGSWRGSQADWLENSVEEAGGTGDNTYFRNYVDNAVVPLLSSCCFCLAGANPATTTGDWLRHDRVSGVM